MFNFRKIDYKHESIWRYIDALFPRVMALLLHTLLYFKYGSGVYAFAAWSAGAYALVSNLIPDPHAYLLVRGRGPRITRLASLATPALIVKTILIWLLMLGVLNFIVSDELTKDLSGNYWILAILSILVYGGSEAWWSYVSLYGLANDTMMKIALKGSIARIIGLSLVVIAQYLDITNLYLDLIIYSMFTLLIAISIVPISTRPSRIIKYTLFSVKKYAFWSQGLGLITGTMTQALPLGAGFIQGVSSNQIGQIAYVFRIIVALLTPFQILQSLVLKAQNTKGYSSKAMTKMRRAFKIGGVVLGIVGLAMIGLAMVPLSVLKLLDYEVLAAVGIQAIGLGLFTFYRYELLSLIAQQRIRQLVLSGYLIPSLTAIVLAGISGSLFGIVGLSLATLIFWAWSSWAWKYLALPRIIKK